MPRPPTNEWPSRLFRASPTYRRAASDLGDKIRELRERHRWTLERAAEEIELDPTQLAKIEGGAGNVTLVTLVRIAEGFDVSIRTLFPARRRPRKG